MPKCNHSHGSHEEDTYQPKTKTGAALKWAAGAPGAFFGAVAHGSIVFLGVKTIGESAVEKHWMSEDTLKALLITAAAVEFIQSVFLDGKYALIMFAKLGDWISEHLCCSSKEKTATQPNLTTPLRSIAEGEIPTVSIIPARVNRRPEIATWITGLPTCLIGGLVHGGLSFKGGNEMLITFGMEDKQAIFWLALTAGIVDGILTLGTEGSHTMSGFSKLFSMCCTTDGHSESDHDHGHSHGGHGHGESHHGHSHGGPFGGGR